MAKITNMKVPISDLTKTVTCEIELTGERTAKFRLSVGIILFKFATWVAGMKGKVTVGKQTVGEIE